MSDSQATEIVDLLSDDSEAETPLQSGVDAAKSASRKRSRSLDISVPAKPQSQAAMTQSPDQGNPEKVSSPLNGFGLFHLSVSPDDDAGLAGTSPDELQLVLPQLNPPDRCLSLQQLVHPHLQHSFAPQRVEALLATTFVGGIPAALQPFVYGAHSAVSNADEEQITAPVSPPCPVTIVKHSGDRKGQSSAALLLVPSSTGHSLVVVQPPLPRSTHYGTAHSKIVAVRWGPGVLYPHGTLRIAVLTANLCNYDLSDCYQCAWAQDFPVREASAADAAASPPRCEQWVPCDCGGVEHRLRAAAGSSDHGRYFRNVLADGMQVPPERVDALLHNVDWSHCAVDFVATNAGLWSQPSAMLDNGLYRLAAVRARQRAAAGDIVGSKLLPPSSSASSSDALAVGDEVQRIWSQVSSLGSILDSSFNLSHLVLAANGALDARKWGKAGPMPRDVSKLVPHCDIIASKRGDCLPGSMRSSASFHRLLQLAERCTPPTAAQRRAGSYSDLWRDKPSRPANFSVPVKLFWPSVQFIRGTRHRSVGNVLMQEQHWKSDAFPRAAMNAFQLNPRWYRSDVEQQSPAGAASAAGGAADCTDGASPRCAPGLASPLSSHTKLLGPQIDPTTKDSRDAWRVGAGDTRVRLLRDWLYVGSHNLSRSAWGALQKSTAHGGAVTMSCNNHEFGVVFRPVFLEQRVASKCSCSASSSKSVATLAPPFEFVHDLQAPPLQEQGNEPWTQQCSAADQQAVMMARMAQLMGGQ